MSRIRKGACAEPGPRDLHCSAYPLHRYSCYDAGDDSSWNDRFPEDWQIDTPHECDDPACTASLTEGSTPHTRGEFVNGLGWSCINCDTFYCPVANGGSTPVVDSAAEHNDQQGQS